MVFYLSLSIFSADNLGQNILEQSQILPFLLFFHELTGFNGPVED